MPSLFSRSHQPPKRDRAPAVLVTGSPTAGDRRVLGLAKTWNGSSAVPPSASVGEFGTVPGSPRTVNAPTSPGAQSDLTPSASAQTLLPLQYSFLTTNVPLSAQTFVASDSASVTEDPNAPRPYGFLGGAGKNVILGLDEVARIIRDVGAELGRRALDTPMLFSNQSLELNQTRLKMFIQSFVKTVRTSSRTPPKSAHDNFLQDVKFASDHELAWLLRWALARMTRVREGTREACHGCFDWDVYEEWRGRERLAKYPTDAFTTLGSILPSDVYYYIVNPLFGLLSRFAAHSHLSGLTPHSLASLFAPLLFDIPTNTPCLVAHSAFVKAASATEHLLLSYIRSTGKKDGLGLSDLPSRLKEWVNGYPSMIASDADLSRGRPRRAARVVRCEVASRTVRAYSRDLVVNAETWVDDIPTGWDTWGRVVLSNRRGEASRPKFSAPWRRKMSVKESLPLPLSHKQGDTKTVYGMSLKPKEANKSDDKDEAEDGKFGSLAGKEWSAFEDMGFDAPKQRNPNASSSSQNSDPGDIGQRLQFDLNESAKMSVAERRQTMDWSEFAAAGGGFSRSEPFLTASLTFSAPVQSSITEWPKERDELRRRLQKTQKEATPFTHDTTPRTGPAAGFEGADSKGRIYLEEAFVDCWADLMMGAGWTDREELTFKEAAWALIEYRARPNHPEEQDAPHPHKDPRTTDIYFLFEERVPLDYQMAVADPKRKKTLQSIFSRRKKEKSQYGSDKRHEDFDKMLFRGSQKKLTLSRADHSVSSSLWHAAADPTTPKTTAKVPPLPPLPKNVSSKPLAVPTISKSAGNSPSTPEAVGRKRADDEQSKASSTSRANIFKSIRRVKSGTDQREKARKNRSDQQREVSMDFELQSASGLSSGNNSPQGDTEEKWMDILIANGARPMNRDATVKDLSLTEKSPARKLDVSPPAGKFSRLSVSPKPATNKPLPALEPPLQLQSADRLSDGAGEYEYDRSVDAHGREYDDVADGHNRPQHYHYENDDSQPLYDHGAGNSYSHHGGLDSHASSVRTSNGDDTSVQPSDSISMRRRQSPSDSPVAATREILTLEEEESTTEPPYSPGYEGLVAPKPRVASQRDALFSIVDGYRDSAATNNTDFTEFSEDAAYGGIDDNRDSYIERTYASERTNSAYGGERDSVIERVFAQERQNSANVADEYGLNPPGPIFDLTPGREPSPARYKHGEPLHFVGEEEEEEGY
ncbi:uncharacterized protein LOC62_02G002931 [Vanrija pseudolonga]|uniref:Meiotically up-regulated protein Msb1/Mug8 domain-containing protein n=1 Tax=Vanrija pseudolonga TaxID=143232 RepID=A0AAF1BKB2_9TREE|nr:hypothetical protein LOC62_02G002931 [Vanrija pseudolonga]